MVKIWSADDPKAGLMARKRAALVEAATRHFLEHGYAESSVNRIADDAGVSIKTLYRHFDNKDDLFAAVMKAVCEANAAPDPQTADAKRAARSLAYIGREYLRHRLTDEQLALYRVVTRDAHRFPELGRIYREQIVDSRERVFAAYVAAWAAQTQRKLRDAPALAAAYAGLLEQGLVDDVLHGVRQATDGEIRKRADASAKLLTAMLDAGAFV